MAAVALNIIGNSRGLQRSLGSARRSLGQFRRDAAAAGGGLSGLGAGVRGLSSAFSGLGGVAAAAGLAVVARAAIQAVTSVDEARKSLILATGANGAALAALERDVQAVYAVVPEQLGAVADVVGTVATAFSEEAAPAIREASEAWIDLARVSGASAQTVAKQGSQVVKLYQQASDDVATFGDVATYVGQEYGLGINELLTSLQKLGPQLQALGLDLFESADVLGQFDKAGLVIRKLGALLDAFIGRQVALGNEPRHALLALQEAIGGAATRYDALQIAAEAVGQTYAHTLVAAFESGNIQLRETIDLVDKTNGLLADTEQRTRTMGETWSQAWAGMQAAVAPVLGEIAHVATEAFEALGLVDTDRAEVLANRRRSIPDLVDDIRGREDIADPLAGLRDGELDDLIRSDDAWARLEAGRGGNYWSGYHHTQEGLADALGYLRSQDYRRRVRGGLHDQLADVEGHGLTANLAGQSDLAGRLLAIENALAAGYLSQGLAADQYADIARQGQGTAIGAEAGRLAQDIRRSALVEERQGEVAYQRALLGAGRGSNRALLGALEELWNAQDPNSIARLRTEGEILRTRESLSDLASAVDTASDTLYRFADGVLELADGAIFRAHDIVSQQTSSEGGVTSTSTVLDTGYPADGPAQTAARADGGQQETRTYAFW